LTRSAWIATAGRGCFIDRETLEILLSKPERITGFDPAIVEGIRSRIGGRAAALVEIAGRDSVAAAVSAARSGAYGVLVPTVVYTGTEFGDWEAVLENARSLAGRLADIESVEVSDWPVLLGSPRWWHASAGRYAGELARRYGFNPVCIACHMYIHAARVPLALELGARAIVSGERLLHGGTVKLNQLDSVLDGYSSVLADIGLELDLPIRGLDEGRQVEALVGEWPESGGQMSCTLSSNYRDAAGGVTYPEGSVERYLAEFLLPYTRRVLAEFRQGAVPVDYAGIAKLLISEGGSS
jgi:hypothetical protein